MSDGLKSGVSDAGRDIVTLWGVRMMHPHKLVVLQAVFRGQGKALRNKCPPELHIITGKVSVCVHLDLISAWLAPGDR